MSLLVLQDVTKHGTEGRRRRRLLEQVTITVEHGELAVVLAANRHECSALIRIAAGLENPDSGQALLDGQDLARHGEELRGVAVGYIGRTLHGGEGRSVTSLIAAGLLAHGIGAREAHQRAQAALEQVGAGDCGALASSELAEQETIRVAIARALALGPRLVTIEEPIKGLSAQQRDELLAVLRALADEGLAVLAGSADPAGLSGADSTHTLDGARLRSSSTPKLADVVQLRRADG